MPRLLCSPCYERDRRAPASNLDAVRAYGSTPRCDDCEATEGERQEAARFAAYHGGGIVSLDEQTAAARSAKR